MILTIQSMLKPFEAVVVSSCYRFHQFLFKGPLSCFVTLDERSEVTNICHLISALGFHGLVVSAHNHWAELISVALKQENPLITWKTRVNDKINKKNCDRPPAPSGSSRIRLCCHERNVHEIGKAKTITGNWGSHPPPPYAVPLMVLWGILAIDTVGIYLTVSQLSLQAELVAFSQLPELQSPLLL